MLTNAHVAGTKIGRTVQVDIESLGIRKPAKVIRAAYSNQVVADWAVLFIEGFQDIAPVYLSKKSPAAGESLYTKGFPRCNAHAGTDITQHRTLNTGVMLWLPDAIGGQSGSGVWNDVTNLQQALLTWSWGDGRRTYGAGQLTSEIYRQNRSFSLVGHPKMEGLVELNDYDMPENMAGVIDDPVCEQGFFTGPVERGIQDLPIWFEDQVTPPVDPDEPTDPGDPADPTDPETRKRLAEYFREQAELSDKYRKHFEGAAAPVDPVPPGDDAGPMFGLG